MRGGATRAFPLLAAILLLFGAACAPRLQAPGPGSPDGARLADKLFITDDGVALPMRRWLPAGRPRAVIVALHGMNDYSRAFELPGPYWAARGIATFAYDQRGFGGTPQRGVWAGTDRLIDDLRQVAGTLVERYPGVPLYLLGTSMGGAVVMAAAADPAPPVNDGVILVAPAVWGRDTLPTLYTASLWIATHTMPGMMVTGRGLDIQPTDNIEVLRQMVADPYIIKETRIDALYGIVNLMDRAAAAAPLLTNRALFLYGEKDEVIPKDATFAMLESLPSDDEGRQRRALYPDGYHMLLRDLEAEVVWRDVADWVGDPNTDLPSGADRRPLAILVDDD